MGLAVFFAIVVLALGVIADLVLAWVRRLLGVDRRAGRTPNLLARTLAAAPALWIAGFAALVGRAWLRVGERPVGMRWSGPTPFDYVSPNVSPDSFAEHGAALFGAFPFVPLALSPVLALVVWAVRRDWRDPAERRRAAACAATSFAFFVVVALDPGGFWDWFLD